MIPYFMLLFIPLFLQIWLKASNGTICVGKSRRRATSKNIAIPVFFFLFTILLALRDKTVGRDLHNYEVIFNAIGKGKLFQSFSGISEPVFLLYNWLIYNYISDSFQVFLAITSVITGSLIALVYCKDKSHGYIKLVLFINMSTFIMLFSGIRQGLAMALGMLAYQFVKDKKYLLFFFAALLASFTHHSGFMVFFLLPLFILRFKKKDLLWIIPMVGIVIVFSDRIFNSLSVVLSSNNEKFSADAESTGAIGSFVLFSLLSIFCYYISDERQMDDEAFALRNILVFATVMQIFASLNPVAMRMNYYFILLIPITIGKSLNSVKQENKQVAKLGEKVICIVFSILFFYKTYMSFISGISTLDTIPYIPFWEG